MTLRCRADRRIPFDWPAKTPLLATWFARRVVLRAVIRGGRADEHLGLPLVQPVRSSELVYLILLGVARVEIVAHHVRHVQGLGRGTKVDAVRLQEAGEVPVRLVGARDASWHQ
jgi:hypothetical protein